MNPSIGRDDRPRPTPTVSRRGVLAGAGVALSLAFAPIGVLAGDGWTAELEGPARGESEARPAVTVVEDDEHVEYLEDRDEVRFVMAWRRVERSDDEPPEQEPVFETTSWERWGAMQSRRAASKAAADHVAEALDLEWVGSGVRRIDDGSAAVVTLIDEEDGPDVTFDELVAATPATVHVSYVLDEMEFEYDAPIFARMQEPIEPDIDEVGPVSPAHSDGSNESGDSDDTVVTDALPGFGAVAALGGVAAALVTARFRSWTNL